MPEGLVGQQAVADRLVGLLAAPLPRLALLVGEGGIGKTAQLDRAAALAAADGWPVRRAVALGGGSPAGWLWRQALPDAATPSAFDVPAVYESVLAAVRRRPRVLVVLDDVQWADHLSLEVLRLLLASPGAPVLVLAALRPESAPRTGPVAEELRALGSRAEHVAVEALDAAETAALFARESGDPPLPALRHDVWRATAGNPYLVVQLARSQRQSSGIHRPDLSTGFRIPNGVSDILREQLAALDGPARDVLRTAAVAGESFDVRLLTAAVGDPRGAVDALDEAVRANVLRETEVAGTYAFRHALLREALYDELDHDERRRLHGRLADLLDGTSATGAQALAHHRFKELDPGRAREVVQLLVRAADEAGADGDVDARERHRRRAEKVAGVFGVPLPMGVRRAPRPPTRVAALAREGDVWHVTFDGQSVRLRDSLGLQHLAVLVTSPGRELHCLELAGGDDPALAALAAESPLPALDAAALAAYRHRLVELKEDLHEAEAFADDGHAERLREELDFLTQELASATGLGGRPRRAPAASERARVSVTRALRAAVDRIATDLPHLGEHLRASVHTGTFVSYSPAERTVTWTVQR